MIDEINDMFDDHQNDLIIHSLNLRPVFHFDDQPEIDCVIDEISNNREFVIF